MQIQNKEKSNIYILVFLVISVIFILFNFLPISQPIRNVFDTVYSPLAFFGGKWGSSFKEIAKIIPNIGEINEEISSLKLRIGELESQNAFNTVLVEKYSALLNQIKLGKKEWEYVEAEVVNYDDGLVINRGKNDVSVGNIAIVGNTYLGRVSVVDERYSKIMLPHDIGSSLEVYIIKPIDTTNLKVVDIPKRLSQKTIKAVAIGNGIDIDVENILSTQTVEEGSIVIVSQEEIGEYLVLGRLTSIKKDKASTVISGKVNAVFDYSSLKFVYVKK